MAKGPSRRRRRTSCVGAMVLRLGGQGARGLRALRKSDRRNRKDATTRSGRLVERRWSLHKHRSAGASVGLLAIAPTRRRYAPQPELVALVVCLVAPFGRALFRVAAPDSRVRQ